MSQSNGYAAVARAQDEDTEPAAPADAPEYSFDGYVIDVSQKIALTPLAKHHRHHAPHGTPSSQ